MFEVDKKKLEKAILDHVDEIAFDCWCTVSQCIGKFTINGKRVQVHLRVTRDADELITDVPKKHLCVTKAKFVIAA